MSAIRRAEGETLEWGKCCQYSIPEARFSSCIPLCMYAYNLIVLSVSMCLGNSEMSFFPIQHMRCREKGKGKGGRMRMERGARWGGSSDCWQRSERAQSADIFGILNEGVGSTSAPILLCAFHCIAVISQATLMKQSLRWNCFSLQCDHWLFHTTHLQERQRGLSCSNKPAWSVSEN